MSLVETSGYLPEEAIEEQNKKELLELGIESNEQNIEAMRLFMDTPQLPTENEGKSFQGIIDVLSKPEDNPEELGKQMQEAGIKKIIHAEGPTVWDHVKETIKVIDDMEISDDEKKALKVVMLYHDYGKPEAAQLDDSKKVTTKSINRGELKVAMIFHEIFDKLEGDQRTKIEEGLEANGISKEDQKEWLTVIENHMFPFKEKPDELRTARFINSLGDETDSILKKISLLTEADQKGTKVATLSPDGECKIESKFYDFREIADRMKKTLELMREAYMISHDIPEDEFDTSSKEFDGFMKNWNQEMKKAKIDVNSFLGDPDGFRIEYGKYIEEQKLNDKINAKLKEVFGKKWKKALPGLFIKVGISPGPAFGEASNTVKEFVGRKIEEEGESVEITREEIEELLK